MRVAAHIMKLVAFASVEKLVEGVETAVAHEIAASVQLAAGVAPATGEEPAGEV